jgi:FAD/FMN-containing dehydrogenase
LSGPRRLGYGTARDWLIGLKAVMADGRVIESGGKVVKNVAGYDLHKLLIGAGGELALIVEATFKLNPRPAAEIALAAKLDSPPNALAIARKILDLPVNPVALDLVKLTHENVRLIVAFAGTEREVEWQREQISQLTPWQPATLEYEEEFHRLLQGKSPRRRSVLPSRLENELSDEIDPPWIARVGNGVIHSMPGNDPESSPPPNPLAERIRKLFDPHGVLSSPGRKGDILVALARDEATGMSPFPMKASTATDSPA